MFSGIVETTTLSLNVQKSKQILQIALKRPKSFKSLKEGDSLSVDGVCLTLEKFDSKKMFFDIGLETLKITKWNKKKLENKIFNLERSLTLKSALGGHLMTGHIDGLAHVKKVKKKGASTLLSLEIPTKYKKFFWKKGYIGLNGLSLTINEIKGNCLEVCLIPKTLKLTNISLVKEGGFLNFEVDYFTRIVVHSFKKKLSFKNS